MQNKSKIYIINWLNFGLIVIILMVIIGGITRLTQSGLSITDWKPVTGIIPPLNKDEWSVAFNEYKKFPEFNNLNFNMTISEYKTIYYWEYFHRLLGRIIGLIFLIPFLYFYYKNYLDSKLIKRLLILFLLGLSQGLMGWYMVKSGLVDDPHISHYRLAAHFLLALIIIAYIYWIKLSLEFSNKMKVENFKYLNNLTNVVLLIFFIQITYGAFSAGLKVGQFWNTFPLIEGKIIPVDILHLKPLCLNFLESPKTIQFIHRYMGVILLISIYFLSFKIKKIGVEFDFKSRCLVTLITCQFFLGIITLISKVPIILGISHQLLAIFLLLLLLNTKHSLKYK